MGKRNSKRPTWRGDFRPGTRSELAPRDLFRRHMGDLAITRGAMLTLVAMLDMSDASLARIWWSREKLAAARGVAPCTITRHVNELEAVGAIEVDRATPFESPTHGWTRWRTNRYRFCRHRRAKKESPARAPAPEPTPAVSSPPAATHGELFELSHPPPPPDDDSTRHDESAADAREAIARWRAENPGPSARVVRLRDEARRKNFELSEH